MAKTTFTTIVEPQDGLTMKATARDMSYLIDEPVDAGGNDKGMTPVESLLGALGACKGIVIRMFADKFRIKLNNYHLEIQGELDPAGFVGQADVPFGFTHIKTIYHLDTENEAKDVERFIKFVEEHCPVKATLSQPAEMDFEIK